MSYGIRNTLILLIVLTTFVGAGWGYIYFYQQPEIESLQKELQNKKQELNTDQQIANQYPTLQKQFDKSSEFLNNYKKALYPSSNEDYVFAFLNSISSGSAKTQFVFNFSDSTTYEKYGKITMELSGSGYYRNFMNFLRQIELNRPINKITQISVSPINQLEDYGKVNYSISLESYYDRVKLLGEPQIDITNNLVASVYNPFYPLIRSVPPNENNLVNVEQSSLIALSGNRAFLMDQNGEMQSISTGGKVYLGELKSIDVKNGTATFQLNKGGIVENLTLNISNDENKQSN